MQLVHYGALKSGDLPSKPVFPPMIHFRGAPVGRADGALGAATKDTVLVESRPGSGFGNGSKP